MEDQDVTKARANSLRGRKTVKIKVRTYVPLSHDCADLFANLVASLELYATAIELWGIWKDELKDENSKQFVQRIIIILSRYLGYPEGRAFSLYQQKKSAALKRSWRRFP